MAKKSTGRSPDTAGRRVSRKEQRRLEMARARRRRNLLIAAPIVAAAVIILVLVLLRLRPIEGLQSFPALSRDHVTDATFAETGLPPTGGAHSPTWQNCGIYDIPVENETAVHSLEHGAIWIAYHPDLPADEVEALRDLARGRNLMLVAPFPDLDGNIAVSAWGQQIVVADSQDGRIGQFIARFRGQGPEPGAPCDGGVGQPIE